MRVAVQSRGKGSGTGNGKGKTMERSGKVKGKAGEKAGGKGRQGTERKARARSGQKSQRGGSPVLLHPVAFRKNGRRGKGNSSRKGKGQTRPEKAYDPALPRSGSGNGMGKAVEKQWKGMGKAGERQGKGKGFKCWSLFRFRLSCRLEGFWFRV